MTEVLQQGRATGVYRDLVMEQKGHQSDAASL